MAAAATDARRKFVVMMIQEDHRGYQDFRMPELFSLAHMQKLPHDFYDPASLSTTHPFLECKFDSAEQAQRLVERAVLVRQVFEVWGEGRTFEECVESTRQFPKELIQPHANKTWEIRTESFDGTTLAADKKSMIDSFSFIFNDFTADCKLVNAEQYFGILIHYQRGIKHNDPSTPIKYWFGRRIATTSRAMVEKYTLKKRTWIGPTSTAAELSFLMSNMGQVTNKSLVLDPFVGTGSLLVSSAHFGAMCLGCDIDYHTLEGKGEDKTILANFRQYKLTKPDIFRADQSRHPWKQLSRHLSGCDFQVDAIICDPPYGIRAGAKKIRSIPDQVILAGKPHHQQKEQYPIEEVTSDLLVFAAQHLVMNGRLVFLFPTTNEFKPSDLSSHPCLEVIANSEQVLQGVFRRRLVTMQKVRPFDPTFKVSHPDYEPAHHNLYEKYYGIAPSPNHEPRSKRQKQPAVANASEAASKEMTDA